MEETPNSKAREIPNTEQNPTTAVSINDENVQSPKSTFERTQGAAGIEGQRCEINLVILVLLKATIDPEVSNFFLASNFLKADKFDDVVFKYEKKEKLRIVFLQAKHKADNAKPVNLASVFSDSIKTDFPLPKYFISYRKIRKHFSSENKNDPIFNEKFNNCEFLIYTNAAFHYDNRAGVKEFKMDEEDLLNVANSSGKFFQFEIDTKIQLKSNETVFDLLKNVSDSQRLAKALSEVLKSGEGIDIQKEIFKTYQKALQMKLIERNEDEQTNKNEKPNKKGIKHSSKIFGKLRENFLNAQNLSEQDEQFRKVFIEEAEKVFKKSGEGLMEELQSTVIKLSEKFFVNTSCDTSEFPNDQINENEIMDFLSKFKFYASQPNERELAKAIKDIAKKFHRIEEQDIDSFFSDVATMVEDWWRSDNHYLTKENRFFETATRTCIQFNVKEPVASFTGRDHELTDLHKILQGEGKAVVSQKASITGLGGVGKTELARKYLSQYKDKYDKNIIWINADSYLTVSQSFRELAENKLQIETKNKQGEEKEIEHVVESVYNFFETRHRKSIFVFDNADKHKMIGRREEGVDKFFPRTGSNNVFVLITSRDQEWGEINNLPLDVFSLDEAVEFIQKAVTNSVERVDAEKLANELGCLPLALRQAISYINAQNKESEKWKEKLFTINDYLENFQERVSELPGNEDQYTATVMTTWKITMEKFKLKKYLGGYEAVQLLQLMAYLSPEKIPVDDIFSPLIEDKYLRHGAVDLLDQYSMVNLHDGKVNIHRLLQQVTRIELEQRGKSEETIQKIFQLLEVSFPYGEKMSQDFSKKKELISHLESFCVNLEAHLKKQPSQLDPKLGITLMWMDDGYSALDMPKRRKELLEKAVQIWEALYGPNDVRVADALVNLGNAYADLGFHREEKEKLERALKIEEDFYGQHHVKTAETLSNLANAYGSLGDCRQKEELLQLVLRILEEHYGQDDVKLVNTLVNLGNVYGDLGKLVEAKKCLKRGLKIEENFYGSGHPDVAVTKMNLAVSYGELGDLPKKKKLLEMAFPILEKFYGGEHFKIYQALFELANVHHELGDLDKAKELLERALPILENRFTQQNYFEKATILANLGSVYWDLGDHQKTKELNKQALAICEEHFPPGHFKIATILNNISLVTRDSQEASENLERALAIEEKWYGRGHFKTASTLHALAVATTNNPKKKLELLERALKLNQDHFGPNHFKNIPVLINISNCYTDLSSFCEAKNHLKTALAIAVEHYGPDHFEVAKIHSNLGTIHGKLGNPKKSKQLLEQALPVLKRHYGPNHYEIAIVLENLGNAHGCLRDFDTKKSLLEQALHIFETNSSTDPLQIAVTFVNLGNAFGSLGHFQKKKDLLEKSLNIFKPDHFQYAEALINLANTNRDLGNFPEAIEQCERALAIQEEFYGLEHIAVAKTVLNLGIAFGENGNFSKKMKLLERALKIFEKNGELNQNDLGSTLHNLGNVYGKLGNVQRKKEFLERALTIYEKITGPERCEVGRVLFNLGVACGDLGDFEKKVELLERALPLLEDHGEISKTISNLSSDYGILGKIEKLDECLEMILNIQEQCSERDEFEVAHAFLKLGVSYGDSGDVQKKKELLQMALPAFEKCGHSFVPVLRKEINDLSRSLEVFRPLDTSES